MTYFGFLGIFLVIPIGLLLGVSLLDARRGIRLPSHWQSWPAWMILLAHVVIAVVYTTPWDNYLVATRVWWYDPQLVTGHLIGYVPIEEYTFFVLQPVLTGLWLLLIARRTAHVRQTESATIRRRLLIIAALLWIVAVAILAVGWKPGTYFGLLMSWALPPVMIQVAFGGDILWQNRRIILLSVLPMTLYLAAVDKLAITSGTWTINPEQSFGIYILGRLPVEEFLFFLMTNLLISLGITLIASTEGKQRASRYIERVREYVGQRQKVSIHHVKSQ